MQADYLRCRDIMQACHAAYPNPVHLAELCDKLADRVQRSIEYHIQVLEEEGFVESTKLQSKDGSVIQNVRLSHPLAADRFVDSRRDGPTD